MYQIANHAPPISIVAMALAYHALAAKSALPNQPPCPIAYRVDSSILLFVFFQTMFAILSIIATVSHAFSRYLFFKTDQFVTK